VYKRQLNELAEAINDDSNFAGSVTASLATKLNISDFDSSFDNAIANVSVGDLSDVDITTTAPTNGQILTWDSANSKFVPSDASSGGATESSYTSSTLSQQVVDTFAIADYRGGEYLVVTAADLEFNLRKLLVVHDGTNAYITEYGEIGSDVDGNGTFNVQINGANFELLYTPDNAASTVQFTRNLLSNPGTYTEFPEDLMQGSGTIDLMNDGSPIDLMN